MYILENMEQAGILFINDIKNKSNGHFLNYKI